MTGVYTILNLVTGRCYVGSSVNVPSRWHTHLSGLRKGAHHCAALQADWIQYGSKAFTWSLVQECETRDEAILGEQSVIDSTPNLYNAARRAGSGPRDGFRHTAESRRRMSEALKGKPKSAEHRAKISALKKGKPNPKHARALLGRHHTAAHCEKIRIANTGKTHTNEHKDYMRSLMTGRVVTWGDKISAGKIGKPWTEQRRAACVVKSLEEN